MQETVIVGEKDQELVHALQTLPRAPWSTLAGVLGTAPETLERRWERLRANGLAWITALPGGSLPSRAVLAYVGVSCAPAETPRIATALSANPEVLSVEVTTGRHDLLLTLASTDLGALTTCLLESIDTVPGVIRTHAMLSTTVYKVGTDWRLSSLSSRQTARLSSPPRSTAAWERTTTLDEIDRILFDALAQDGRTTNTALAERAGISRNTAQRRVEWMLRTGVFGIRCEVAGPAFGWPVSASFGIEIAPESLPELGAHLARDRRTRLVAVLADNPNVLVTCWLRGMQEILSFEAQIRVKHPRIRIRDRYVNLYAAKRMGWLLDRRGRVQEQVLPPSIVTAV